MINMYEHTAMARGFYGMEYDFTEGHGTWKWKWNLNNLGPASISEDQDPLPTSSWGLKRNSVPGASMASSKSSNYFLYSFAAGVMGSFYAL